MSLRAAKKQSGYPNGPITPLGYILRWADPYAIAYVVVSAMLIGGFAVASWIWR